VRKNEQLSKQGNEEKLGQRKNLAGRKALPLFIPG
jgi:hypothetical protein